MTDETKPLTATQKNMLDVANQHDLAQRGREVKLGKTIISVPAEKLPAIPPAHELELNETETKDPFGGNQNNLRVAERVASEQKQWFNAHPVPHKGDPVKAAHDVALSRSLNPAGMTDIEKEEADNAEKRKPMLGTPRADRLSSASEPATTGTTVTTTAPTAPAFVAPGAPGWKPNSGSGQSGT